MYRLYKGDCLDIMPTLGAGSVDAVIADIPYGTTACAWDAVIPFDAMWYEIEYVIKPGAPVVLFGSQPFTSALVMSRPEWFRVEWVWHKSNGGGFLNANRYPLKRHEAVLVFAEALPSYYPQMGRGPSYRATRGAAGGTTFDQTVAGWETINSGRRYPTSVLKFANETGLHPTQKPVALMECLVKTYTNEGETVLDFTMGSGTTGVACLKTGRRFIGIERDVNHFLTAESRIAREARQARQLELV